ncbi:complement decay-accelerating factor, GPI-anchored isoform X2 [Synchiropus splendidus]|uniref:complement decay-accelerating factor, GPI-anchored isoform X2 n=1 Tax=Synchiropus splendidus TaxID=270530 RepID=UPI00237DBE40|nr:complement decay-accelerating factor, GPI-anchored isoform X2 [Synchiropus splendidus]
MEAGTAKFRRWSFTLALLTCVFVAEVAADCPMPQVNFRDDKGLILTDETILMSSFPEGVKITLECARGRFHANGSATATCVDGKWAEPDMVCKKRDCGVPETIPNMNFDFSEGTLFGAAIKATCKEGYRIEGVSYLECYSKGWKGKASCHPVTCALPVEVTNGTFNWASSEKPKYGDVVEYSCDYGYTLVGLANLRCTETGKYDAEPPKCEDLRVATTNSEDRLTSQTVQTTPVMQETTATAAPTTADRDKSLTSPATPREGNRGTVVPNQVAATPDPSAALNIFGADCPMPQVNFRDDKGLILTDGTILMSSFPEGVKITLECARGRFHASGSATVTCEDGKWAEPDMVCKRSLPVIITGAVVVLLIGLAAGIVLYRFLLRRKGSYDTREDLKPELLSVQNL